MIVGDRGMFSAECERSSSRAERLQLCGQRGQPGRLERLSRLRQRADKEKLSQKAIIERPTRILVAAKVGKYFAYVSRAG